MASVVRAHAHDAEGHTVPSYEFLIEPPGYVLCLCSLLSTSILCSENDIRYALIFAAEIFRNAL